MKKVFFMLFVMLFIGIAAQANNVSTNVSSPNPTEQNEPTVLECWSFVFTCGNSQTYCPPDGDTLLNIINAAINLNNSTCGTNIPLIEELEEVV